MKRHSGWNISRTHFHVGLIPAPLLSFLFQHGTFGFRGDLKDAMSYALFSKDQQISKAFASAEEVWDHADTAGLVDRYEKDGRTHRELSEQYQVKKVQPAQEAPVKRSA